MKAIEDLRKAQEAVRQMNHVVSRVQSRQNKYQAEIERLREGLPELLTAVELEEISRRKADEAKVGIRILETRMKDIPMILQGLERRVLLCNYAVKDSIRELEKIYKSVKEKLEGDETVNLDDLKTVAEAIGYTEDLKDCLNKIAFNK